MDNDELAERHATDFVTALNFDLRAFDTLGEEFILFASVVGVVLLLRHLRDEDQSERRRRAQDHRFAGASEALRALSLVLVPLLIALGVYLAIHGALTPGGGFQAGVVLAAGPAGVCSPAAIWRSSGSRPTGRSRPSRRRRRRLRADRPRRPDLRRRLLEELPALGTPGHLLSAGLMPLNSIAVGLEVTGAFLLIWTEFLDQALLVDGGRAMSFLPFAVAAWLFVVGLWGVVSSRNLVRTVLCLTVVQSSTYWCCSASATARRQGADRRRHPAAPKLVDPVVQVLVLTDIVIEATVTALLLALVVQAHKRFGSVDPAELRALRD